MKKEKKLKLVCTEAFKCDERLKKLHMERIRFEKRIDEIDKEIKDLEDLKASWNSIEEDIK